LIMLVFLFLIKIIDVPAIVLTLIQVVGGVAIYTLLLLMFKEELLLKIIDGLNKISKKRRMNI
ncbi:hypothetical protein, partial [Terribacillus saccharophilus]|uniref:hypothetical protein n=1 Tax=Terribacillus saccharophilus TaxID=361277 RepID=UPI000BC6C63B